MYQVGRIVKKRESKTDNSKWLVASKVIDVILYIAIILILIFWQIYPSLFPNLSVETILISILVLFGGSWLHTIENIAQVKKLFLQLDTTDVMQYNFLNKLLDEVREKKSIIRELKILDISAEDFLHLFAEDKIIVNNCTLLLREFDPESSEYNQKLVDQIDDSIKKWKVLEQTGKIKKLNIIRYFTNQSNFFCIIDDEMILSGFQRNEPVREDPNVMLVDITSRKGYQLIQQYVKEFEFISQSAAGRAKSHNGAGNVFAYTNVNKQDAKDKLKRELRNTKTVSVVGLACTEITNLSFDELQDILVKNDGYIRIMFMDPDKDEIKIREKIEHGDHITEFQFPGVVKYNRNRFLTNISAIKVSNNLPDDWKHVQIGKYNFQPSINCILTDEYAFVHYYGMNHCGMDVPSFAISRATDPSIYEYYKNYIEEYWNRGESYD